MMARSPQVIGHTTGKRDYPRPLTRLSPAQEREHLWEVGQRGPSLPIGYRRKRRWGLRDLIAWYLDRAWRANP